MNELMVYGIVGDEISASSFIEQLRNFGDVSDVTVRINSKGGSAFDGFAIYNALHRHPARVRVEIDGLAASAASLIAMAGDEIVMFENSQIMVHCAAMGISLNNYYNAAELESELMPKLVQVSEALKRIDKQLCNMYSARTGHKPETWMRLMEKETYFTAEEAVKKGLADKMIPNKGKPAAAPKRVAAQQSSFDIAAIAAMAEEINRELPALDVPEVPELESETPEPVAVEVDTVNLQDYLAGIAARASEVVE